MNTALSARAPSRTMASATTVGLLSLAQMLPATASTPAVRPLFAELHAGHDGAMHAFFALNMVGGALMAPLVVHALRRGCPPRHAFSWFAAADAVLVASFVLPMSTALLLALRVLEGAVHVGACTLLLTAAASPTRRRSAVPAAGFGIMGAVALGSVFGAALVGLHPRAPLMFASLLLAAVAVAGWFTLDEGAIAVRAKSTPVEHDPALFALASGGMVARFLVGCLVVSFSLLAHRAHGLGDASIGRHFALVTVPFALATPVLVRFAEKRAREAWLVSGMLSMGPACAVLGYLPTRLLAPAMLVIGVGSAAVFASLLAHGATADDELGRARRMATINGAGSVGMLLGPTVAGIVAAIARTPLDATRGQRWSLLVGGVVPVLWAIGHLVRRRTSR